MSRIESGLQELGITLPRSSAQTENMEMPS